MPELNQDQINFFNSVKGMRRYQTASVLKGIKKTDPKIVEYFRGRPMSRREAQLLIPYLNRVNRKMGNPPFYEGLFVIDNAFPEVFSVGGMLFATSEALRNEHLGAMLIHDYGHFLLGHSTLLHALSEIVINDLTGEDKKLWTTTRREKVEPGEHWLEDDRLAEGKLAWAATKALYNRPIFAFLAPAMVTYGTIKGLSNTTRVLDKRTEQIYKYFQAVDFEADELATEVGFGNELITYLETRRVLGSFGRDTLSVEAPVELRLDRLTRARGY